MQVYDFVLKIRLLLEIAASNRAKQARVKEFKVRSSCADFEVDRTQCLIFTRAFSNTKALSLSFPAKKTVIIATDFVSEWHAFCVTGI